jgi:alkylation response protein AidB-like acyl-CoA dehydrogenase
MTAMANREEQDVFRRTVRGFLADKSTEADTRRLMATDRGFDPSVWRQMAQQLGLQGIAVPESYGGQGCSAAELMIVMEEAGRSLLCAPYLATGVLATSALLSSADADAAGRYLPAICSGEVIATLAIFEPSGRWDGAGVETTAELIEDGIFAVSGGKAFVLDGHVADILLVPARTPEGISLFAVDAGTEHVTRSPLPTMDQTRKLADVTFDAAPARLIGVEGEGWTSVEYALHIGSVALAAEQVGAAQFVLDMTLDYVRGRYQFGRPIGSFQAIKHKCADLMVSVELARSAAYHAAETAVLDPAGLPLAASMAKAVCSDVFVQVATEAIQLHGGIGFTWEHPAHLYLKRAKSTQLYLGDSAYHRERVADLLGL